MNIFLLILLSTVLVNNYVLAQTIGICPFLGVSKKIDQALGMGLAVIFVMVLSTLATWPIQSYLLDPNGLGYLQTVVFILVIATLVQFVEIVLKKFLPSLHRALGVYLPLITTNCAVLGITIDVISGGYNFAEAMVASFGAGVGFLLAMLLFSGVRSRMEEANPPRAFRGLPLTLVAASIVSLAFLGFGGIADAYTGNFSHISGAEASPKNILLAVLVVTVLGLLCGIILAVASTKFDVPMDETEGKIRDCLPGANCGSCGFSGCDGYAHALATVPGTKTNLCTPGADAAAKSIANLLGVRFEDVVEQVAVVHCKGTCDAAGDKHNYVGIPSCAAAAGLYGGPGICTEGCLGFGDCAAVCPKNAITCHDGIAEINPADCIGCGLCVKTCPRHIISLFPDVSYVKVECSNHEKGVLTRKACRNGCIGCRKCESACIADAIHVVNNLAVIDYDKCTSCGACADVCPMHVIAHGKNAGAVDRNAEVRF